MRNGKKGALICLSVFVLSLLAACGGLSKEKIKEVQDAYVVSVNLHNEIVEAYADVEDESLSAELDGMAERLKDIGRRDVREMTEEQLDAVKTELEELDARYEQMRLFLEEIGQEQEAEGETLCAVPVTIVNNTGVQLFQLYLYKDPEGDKGSNLVEDIGYLDEYQTRSILNLYMEDGERLWYLEAMDEDGNVIESAEVDFSGYGEGGVTIRMEYSVRSKEGRVELE